MENIDSGNNLKYPVMSATLFEDFKQIGILPRTISLDRTSIKAAAANGRSISIKGVLNYEIKFKTEAGTDFIFNKFYVINKLANDLNLGKLQLDQLDVKWDFKKQTVCLLNKTVVLHSQRNKTSREQIQGITLIEDIVDKLETHLDKRKIIRLYSEFNVYVPPRSSIYVPLMAKQVHRDGAIDANGKAMVMSQSEKKRPFLRRYEEQKEIRRSNSRERVATKSHNNSSTQQHQGRHHRFNAQMRQLDTRENDYRRERDAKLKKAQEKIKEQERIQMLLRRDMRRPKEDTNSMRSAAIKKNTTPSINAKNQEKEENRTNTNDQRSKAIVYQTKEVNNETKETQEEFNLLQALQKMEKPKDGKYLCINEVNNETEDTQEEFNLLQALQKMEKQNSDFNNKTHKPSVSENMVLGTDTLLNFEEESEVGAKDDEEDDNMMAMYQQVDGALQAIVDKRTLQLVGYQMPALLEFLKEMEDVTIKQLIDDGNFIYTKETKLQKVPDDVTNTGEISEDKGNANTSKNQGKTGDKQFLIHDIDDFLIHDIDDTDDEMQDETIGGESVVSTSQTAGMNDETIGGESFVSTSLTALSIAIETQREFFLDEENALAKKKRLAQQKANTILAQLSKQKEIKDQLEQGKKEAQEKKDRLYAQYQKMRRNRDRKEKDYYEAKEQTEAKRKEHVEAENDLKNFDPLSGTTEALVARPNYDALLQEWKNVKEYITELDKQQKDLNEQIFSAYDD